MKAFTFKVCVAASDLDKEVVTEIIKEALTDGLPQETLSVVSKPDIKEYCEQGWKVARNRKFGIGVKEAGDAHKATLVIETAKADAILPGV
jgi:hypothetical protein|tara:strand:+ start:3722 stop:3994 length:273 start_codon:yes stop_codon:yes gene_type:complete